MKMGAKLMRPKSSDDERAFVRRMTIVLAASYPLLVLVAATAHFFKPHILAAEVRLFAGRTLPVQPPAPGWQRLREDWPVLLYGPAITLACVWAMVMMGIWIANRFGRR
jgi:hypothetical protein